MGNIEIKEENWYDLLKEIAKRQGYKFDRRPLQEKIIDDLQRHFEEAQDLSVPILIRLPCGYGKTQIGEVVFLGEAFTEKWFTRGMVYTLPTRSLTSQQTERIRRDVECVCSLKPHLNLSVNDFHGESDTYYFYADAVISTFDTFIYAYARKSRTGHHLEFPAGTISTSYVVFDEAHMIQDDYLYAHTVMNRVLRVLSKSGVPTIIMTATMPKPIKDVVFEGIKYYEYPTRGKALGLYRGKIKEVHLHKENIIDYVRRTFSPEVVANKRILIVCNTVRRAQDIYSVIVDTLSANGKSNGLLALLHSRYVKKDRKNKSRLIVKLMKRPECEECGKQIEEFPVYVAEEKGGKYTVYCDNCAPSGAKRFDFVIVVATQVVEAGLDVSANWLLTDAAPLDALVQRSGRCARFIYETDGKIDIFCYDGVHAPYQKDLVEKACKILNDGDNEHRVSSLTDFDYSMDVIDKNYEVFRRRISDDELRTLRLYLGYLEGVGFSTFSVDWRLLRRISARPNAFVMLVAFSEDEKIPVYELEEDGADLRNQGKYRLYHIVEEKKVSYQELLSLIEYNKSVGIKEDFVRLHSFTLNYPYTSRDGQQPKSFLKHSFNEEFSMIELKPVIVEDHLKRECCYLVERVPLRRVEESNYLVNPKFYDVMVGLKDE